MWTESVGVFTLFKASRTDCYIVPSEKEVEKELEEKEE